MHFQTRIIFFFFFFVLFWVNEPILFMSGAVGTLQIGSISSLFLCFPFDSLHLCELWEKQKMYPFTLNISHFSQPPLHFIHFTSLSLYYSIFIFLLSFRLYLFSLFLFPEKDTVTAHHKTIQAFVSTPSFQLKH